MIGRVLLCWMLVAAVAVAEDVMDLTHAVVVTPKSATAREQKAAAMLVEEAAKRTHVPWEIAHEWPKDATAVIALTDDAHAKALLEKHGDVPAPPDHAEAYAIHALDAHTVVVNGRDERGVLFGAGRLLREMKLDTGTATLALAADIAAAPETPLRGHQLGYRPKTNSYDGWTPEMWEQYIRDLAVFGTNAIELIPPRSDDASTSPHFPLPQIEMMKRMSQICDDYGLDVWVWYPALDKDYGDAATVEAALKEWGEVFAQVPRIDAVFVPGGDPGHTEPLKMMALLEKETENLHKTHPNAQMWMSPQGFTKAWMDTYFDYMKTQQPKWLTGVVFGPQNRMKLAELRAALPPQYPIRHYPDITHTIMCQFPVPDWDLAYALTENREPINPRPTQYEHIFHLFNEGTIGFLSYSEGCNDDINKFIWSGLGWDSKQSAETILKSYARYFIGPRREESFAQGVLGLEQDWVGPLLKNEGVPKTLATFQAMERDATDAEKMNWRFQQALYRAYYDAYDYQRLKYETKLQDDALVALAEAPKKGADAAMEASTEILDQAESAPVARELRTRIFALAEALFQSIRMQLSVPLYQAIQVERGANLDLIDFPINDRPWLKDQYFAIRKLEKEKDRLAAIDTIVHWKDAGAGGFYDDFGDPENQPHLVRPAGGYADPEFKTEPNMGRDNNPGWRAAWNTYADTRYEAPLQAHYTGLDARAKYTLRVVYAGDSMDRKMHLYADGIEVHPFIDKPMPPKRIEFAVPQAATADGDLTLTWTQEPGRGGGGRGCEVAEVWLVKE